MKIGLGLLKLIFVALMALIFASALAVVQQTQTHHAKNAELRQKTLQFEELRIQNQRLLIEQQAFSATPQVAQRAVSDLGMFFPVGENRRIISPKIMQNTSQSTPNAKHDAQGENNAKK